MKNLTLTACLHLSLCVLSMAAPGDLDTSFAPNPNSNLSSVMTLPDGKLMLLGNFSTAAGRSQSFVMRLEPSGVPDPTFTANLSGTSALSNPGAFDGAVMNDGRIVLAGLFNVANGISRGFTARLSSTGVLDTTYSGSCDNQVRGLVIQPDDKVVLGGFFTSVNGTALQGIVRLNQDGTVDPGLSNALFTTSPTIRSVARQADGSVLAGGDNPFWRLLRLLPDGSRDTTFEPNIENGGVYSIAVQADQKIIIGGTFTSINGTSKLYCARLNPDGSIDNSFAAFPNGNVRTSSLQSDGKILIGGDFTSVSGATRDRIARLLPSGAADTSFVSGANGRILGITLQADGQVLAAGEYTTMNSVSRSRLARLKNDVATQVLSVTSSTNVVWMRGGSSPEATYTWLELANGDSWIPLGSGTRINGGWDFQPTSQLPSVGRIRARARTAGGYNNGTAGMVETQLDYSLATPLEQWRERYFGSTTNSGAGADSSDPDGDGATNIMEFAFDLNPIVADSLALPQWTWTAQGPEIQFISDVEPGLVTYHAEVSASLEAPDWQPLANLQTPPLYRFVPTPSQMSGPRLYVRFRISVHP